MSQRPDPLPPVTIENARLLYLNFSGREGRMNAAGVMNFSVVIDDPAIAEQMKNDGWNVKYPKPSDRDDDEDDARNPTLPIGVRFDVKPPRIVLVSSAARVMLDEDSVSVLDTIDIAKAHVVARCRWWDDGGVWKVKAYLKSMIVWIDEDPLERKYADIFAEATGTSVETTVLGE